MLVFFLAFLGLVSCSEQPKPEETLESYMDAWENEQYNEMYALLSERSKETISQEDFKDRYTTIYGGINMDDLSVTYNLPEEEQEYDQEEKQTFDYNVSMDSLAGSIEFPHTAELVFEENEEDGQWKIEWSPSMIFAGMEEGDTIRAQTLSPERGEIMDQSGKGLAVNGVVQEVGLVPEWIEDDEKEMKKKLADILDISVDYIDQQLDQSWVQASSFVPLASVSDDAKKKIEKIKALNGTKFQEKTARVYPLGKAAAHLTGYVKDVTAQDLEDNEGQGYTANDQIGKTGLESVLEDELRGTSGGRVSILNEDDEEKEVLAETAAVDGEDVKLTIRADLQQSLYNEMKGDSGVATALNPSTGEVNALVSSPAYDPNEFILGMSNERYTNLQEGDGRPLINKFTKTYAPGSTFKPITAAIGLESGAIDPEAEMSIPEKTYTQDGWGGYSVTRVDSANVEKQVNLRDALLRSDNIYFARSILEIGGDTFLNEASSYGFDEEIPFAYPPDPSQILNDESFGDHEVLLADTGYGQGQVQMSALHLALSYTPFITEGTLLKPTLRADAETGQAWHENVMSAETASIIQDDLTAVVQNSAGSGYEPQLQGMDLAGKTGTAELKQSLEDKNGQENGWFTAWNTESQDLLISMMIEDVEGGSGYVVPKVKNVFDQSR
nr:penicillin-binding transpeptidase domain-containing protein [Thalassobacillus sp. CUG 92003]